MDEGNSTPPPSRRRRRRKDSRNKRTASKKIHNLLYDIRYVVLALLIGLPILAFLVYLFEQL